MANTSYPKGMQKLLSAAINLVSDTIKAALLPSTYTYSTSHEFLSDLGTRVGTDQTLVNPAITGGEFSADELDFGALAPGDTIKALVLYKSTGTASTSPLLAYMDVMPGLPMYTNGGGVTIPWNTGIYKIFGLGLPIYPKGAEKILSGAVNFLVDPLKVALMSNAYTYNAAHEFLSDITAPIGAPLALTGRSVANGVFDADDADFGALPGGDTIVSAVIYKDTGDASTSPLLLHQTAVTGLPLSTNGSEFALRWSATTEKIFSLSPA